MSDETEILGLASMGALSGTAPGNDAEDAAAKNICANCGSELTGKFCDDCGQLASDFHRPIWTLVKDMMSDALSLDGRIARTLPKLLFAPGVITRAYLEGKRARYVPPFRLFLLASLIFFFTLFTMGHRVGWGEELYVLPLPDGGYSITFGAPEFLGGDEAGDLSALSSEEIRDLMLAELEKDGGMGAEQDAFVETAVRVLENQRELTMAIERWVPRLSLTILPFMVLFLTLAYAWVRRIYVYDHVITSLHFQSFAYFLGALIMVIGFFLGGNIAWALLFIPVYLYRQLRVTYQSGRILSGIRALLLLLLLLTCLVLVSVGASMLGYFDLK